MTPTPAITEAREAIDRPRAKYARSIQVETRDPKLARALIDFVCGWQRKVIDGSTVLRFVDDYPPDEVSALPDRASGVDARRPMTREEAAKHIGRKVVYHEHLYRADEKDMHKTITGVSDTTIQTDQGPFTLDAVARNFRWVDTLKPCDMPIAPAPEPPAPDATGETLEREHQQTIGLLKARIASFESELTVRKKEIEHFRPMVESALYFQSEIGSEYPQSKKSLNIAMDVDKRRIVTEQERDALKAKCASFESEVERLTSKSLTCCFCDHSCESLDVLKEHCAHCQSHPAVKTVADLQSERDGLKGKRDYWEGVAKDYCRKSSSKWIPVEQPPTEADGDVLFLRTNGTAFVGKVGTEIGSVRECNLRAAGKAHWMRIPPKPQSAAAEREESR